jgi:alpha(1,3/1,4) fucosyltransferase
LKLKKIALLFCFFSLAALADKGVVYIIPPQGYMKGKLFDLADQAYNRDNCIKHFYDLKIALDKLGFQLKVTPLRRSLPQCEYILWSHLNLKRSQILRLLSKEKLIAHIWEPITVDPDSYKKEYHSIFSKIFIMDDRFVDNKKYFKLFYPHPSVYMINDTVPFEKKNFCTLIAGQKTSTYRHELYSERERAIKFFEKHPKDFKFYGRGWSKRYRNYGGGVLRKVDVLKKFKFCICYENTGDQPGYITEKIFDCFHAGCVPVYLGAPNIKEHVPADCFIDFRSFRDYQKLYAHLKSVSQERYEAYLKNIRDFLESDKAFKFSFFYFIDQTLNEMFPGYNRLEVFDKKIAQRLERLS